MPPVRINAVRPERRHLRHAPFFDGAILAGCRRSPKPPEPRRNAHPPQTSAETYRAQCPASPTSPRRSLPARAPAADRAHIRLQDRPHIPLRAASPESPAQLRIGANLATSAPLQDSPSHAARFEPAKLEYMPRGLILGIESSCDETAAAVVERGARTLSSVVASQIATHARYGGVVPELASREHLRAIVPSSAQPSPRPASPSPILTPSPSPPARASPEPCWSASPTPRRSPSRRACRSSPSIISKATSTPCCCKNGHQRTREPPQSDEPALALVVSGGHTHLYLATPADGTWHYALIGRTLDDAAGEAYDKVAKLLGLGYPGGPWIDALARFGNPHAVPFAFAQIKTKAPPRRQSSPHQGRENRADRRARSAFSVFVFRNQDRRAALRRAAQHARRSRRARLQNACLPRTRRRPKRSGSGLCARSRRSISSPAFSTPSSAT